MSDERHNASMEGVGKWNAPLLLFIVSLLTRVPLAYSGGMSDPDSVVMAAGMARYFSSDTSFGDILLYGRQMNPGIYLVFRFIYTFFFDSPSGVMPFLNGIGVASATLLPLPLYYLFRRTLGESASIGAVLIFILTPLVWESSLSFHAILPAALFLSSACLSWRRIDYSLSGIAWFALTGLLAVSAVVMRLEMMMLAPAFFLSCFLSKKRSRDSALLAVIAVLAVGTHWLVLKAIPGMHTSDGRSIPGYVVHTWESWVTSFSPAGMARTSIWFIFGAGVANLLLVLGGLIVFFRGAGGKNPESSRRMRNLSVAAVIILPILIFWLPQPRAPILRHYFLIVPALAWLIGDTVLRRLSSRRMLAVVIPAIVINLFAPEAAYRSWNAWHPEDTKTPHGSFFYYRSTVSNHIDRYKHLQSIVRTEAGKAGMDFTPGNARRRFVSPAAAIPVNWESYAYILYGMAQDTSLVELAVESDASGILRHRYELGSAEIRLLDSIYFTWDFLPENLIPFMRSAAEEGFVIVIPSELARTARTELPGDVSLIEY